MMARDQPNGRMLLGASDALGAQIEELQFSLGEGPCVSAFADAMPVLIPDLQAYEARARWPMFARGAADSGIGAVFAFPLQIGVIGIGVLDCHRRRPGPFLEIADALAVADAVTTALVDLSALEGPSAIGTSLLDLSWRTHAVVHQATGALSADLEISAVDALARLRAHAFRCSRPLEEVAEDVLAGRLKLTGRPGQPRGHGHRRGVPTAARLRTSAQRATRRPLPGGHRRQEPGPPGAPLRRDDAPDAALIGNHRRWSPSPSPFRMSRIASADSWILRR